jgi:hypothetical protein
MMSGSTSEFIFSQICAGGRPGMGDLLLDVVEQIRAQRSAARSRASSSVGSA